MNNNNFLPITITLFSFASPESKWIWEFNWKRRIVFFHAKIVTDGVTASAFTPRGPEWLWESVKPPTPLTPSPRQTAHFCRETPPVLLRTLQNAHSHHGPTSSTRLRDADVPKSDMSLLIHLLTTLGEFYLLFLNAWAPLRVCAWICQTVNEIQTQTFPPCALRGHGAWTEDSGRKVWQILIPNVPFYSK